MYDSYGDGWNKATYSIQEFSNSFESVVSGTLEDGSQGTDEICLDVGCYIIRVTSGNWPSEITWDFGGLVGGAVPQSPTAVPTLVNTPPSLGSNHGAGDAGFSYHHELLVGDVFWSYSYAPFYSYELGGSYGYADNSMAFVERNIAVTPDGQIELLDGSSCPYTPVPTTATFFPTVTPKPTPTPTVSKLPTTASPTESPIEVEVVTFSELQTALAQAIATGYNLVVTLLADITMTDYVTVENIHMIMRAGADDDAPLVRQRRRLSGTLRGGSHTCRFVEHDGTSCFTVGGGDATQLLRVRSGGWLTIHNMTLRDGFAPASPDIGVGGAISVRDGTVDLKNCALTGNTAWSSGGAIGNYYGTVNLDCCVLKRNHAEFGGAYWTIGDNAKDSVTLIQGCTMTDNMAEIDGGGILLNGGSSGTLRDCVLTGNTAGEWGGAMKNEGSGVRLDNCTLSANTVSAKYAKWSTDIEVHGGAIYTTGRMDLNDCTFIENSAGTKGGALYNSGATVTLNRCALVANNATSAGGGLYAVSGETVLNECMLTRNVAEVGGGLYTRSGRLELNTCNMTMNFAAMHGHIALVEEAGEASFASCSFTSAYNDDDACVIKADEQSFLAFYYQLAAFDYGLVCSESPALVYGANTSIPLSAQYESAMTCGASDILNYCDFDCRDARQGIFCR